MKRAALNMMLLASLLAPAMLVGCDRTVSEKTSTEQKPNGDTVTDTKKTVETPNGEIKKESEHTVNNP